MAAHTTRCRRGQQFEVASRPWGFWTRAKLEILRDYLNAFTTTTKNKSPERIYLDLFAGQAENVDRLTGDPLQGSARIALSIDDPPFTKLRLFDRDHGASLNEVLRTEFPNRDFQVYEDDCNLRLPAVLHELRSLSWAPTFAFLDPNGPDYWWSTLETLANFKIGSKTKVELWILFPVPMFVRFLPTDGGKVRAQDDARITAMYGTDEWHRIYEARLADALTATEARSEYVNLMRWRLSAELGYRWTHTFEVKNESDLPLYYLIFATDSAAGNEIMRSLYEKATIWFPQMREEVLHRRRGIQRLFDPDALGNSAHDQALRYVYEPPAPPYGSSIPRDG